MKRILMLCLLTVIAFGNAEVAKADQFGFGASSFDDQKTMIENLLTILPADSQGALQSINAKAVMNINPAYAALIAVSQDVVGSSIQDSFWLLYESNVIIESSSPNPYWTSEALDLTKVELSWTSPVSGVFPTVSLNDLVNGIYTDNVTVTGAYYYGEELVYQPDGYTPIILDGGTIFVGLNFGWGNEVDVILAFSLAPINAVPVPAAVWLLGSGVAGIMALRKRIS